MTMRSHLKDPSYNEAKKSLEEVFIEVEDGVVKKKIPGLSKYFSCSREMIKYEPPPKWTENQGFDMGAKEDWIIRTESVIEDFSWLLSLEHYKFWSQLMYERNAMDGLVSFLQEGYPFYALDRLPDDPDVMRLYHCTCRLAYLLICRIMTRVESDREWISEKTYGKLLYNNYVISVPMLIDVCAIYGMSNRAEVRSILSSLFSIQPLYRDDLNKMVANVKMLLGSLSERICGGEVVEKLHEKAQISPEFLKDVLTYLLDISVSLAVFVDLCPSAGLVMHTHHFEVTIASFYNSVLPELGVQIRKLHGTESDIVDYLYTTLSLNRVRYHFIKLFHDCLTTSLDTVIAQSASDDEEEVRVAIDNHLLVLNDCLGEKTFVKDYHSQYPIDVQLEHLSTLSPHVDNMKVKFIVDSLAAVGVNLGAKTAARPPSPVPTRRPASSSQVPKSEPEIPPQTSQAVSDDKPDALVSMISELKEIFPHLGEGYLMKCLQHYNNSLPDTLNAILEGTLPKEIQQLDPELPFIEPEVVHPLPKRLNVFDNDEFDFMTRDVIDTSRVHKGKRKEKYHDLAEMLDDKAHVSAMKSTYQSLSNIWVETDADYDDEYDDSYDALPVPVEEVGDERRAFVTPRVLLGGTRKVVEEEEEEPDDEEPEEERPRNSGFVPFVENPENVRARWEAKRRSQQGNRDYKGKPRGQGQEESVLFNRHKKNVNKSVAGNHNRRRGAQHKRNMGMLPS